MEYNNRFKNVGVQVSDECLIMDNGVVKSNPQKMFFQSYFDIIGNSTPLVNPNIFRVKADSDDESQKSYNPG